MDKYFANAENVGIRRRCLPSEDGSSDLVIRVALAAAVRIAQAPGRHKAGAIRYAGKKGFSVA